MNLAVSQICMIGTILLLQGCGQYPKWHEPARQLAVDIQSLFVKVGYCSSHQDCSHQQRVLAGPTGKGVEVSIYEVSDKKIIGDVLAILATSVALNDMKEGTLLVYSHSHEEDMKTSSIFNRRYIARFLIGVN